MIFPIFGMHCNHKQANENFQNEKVWDHKIVKIEYYLADCSEKFLSPSSLCMCQTILSSIKNWPRFREIFSPKWLLKHTP